MEHSEYFRDRVKTFLTYLPERTLNAGVDAVTTIIVYDMAYPCTPQDYQHALASWMQGRHDVWQDRIDKYKSNPTNEGLAAIAELAIREHTPHTQSDFDDLVECMYRLAIKQDAHRKRTRKKEERQ